MKFPLNTLDMVVVMVVVVDMAKAMDMVVVVELDTKAMDMVAQLVE